MIRNYSDHAANERTFLAWIRTGIAVIAFGFVIERFDLFLRSLANFSHIDAEHPLHIGTPGGPLGRYEGLAFIFLGLGIVGLAAVRYLRTERLLESEQANSIGDVRTELVLSAVLVFLVAAYSAYLVFG
jgi:putative membrane protein